MVPRVGRERLDEEASTAAAAAADAAAEAAAAVAAADGRSAASCSAERDAARDAGTALAGWRVAAGGADATAEDAAGSWGGSGPAAPAADAMGVLGAGGRCICAVGEGSASAEGERMPPLGVLAAGDAAAAKEARRRIWARADAAAAAA